MAKKGNGARRDAAAADAVRAALRRDNDAARCELARQRRERPQPSWFSRWREYPGSCAGHVLFWGALPGVLTALGLYAPAVVMLLGFAYYEAGSGYRKAVNHGRTDTVGLDFVDAVVGYVPAYLLARLTLYLLSA